jgi:predicted alpha/beta superfamily hydrolase
MQNETTAGGAAPEQAGAEVASEAPELVNLGTRRLGGPPRAVRVPLVGDLRYHLAFPSRHLGNERTLIVYLPPGYRGAPAQRYPVLYMHDGQNLFDPATAYQGVCWEANDTAERLILTRRLRPLIIVGIYNTPDRVAEYTHSVDDKQQGGKGRLYGRFLFEEVKPFIDQAYRTKPDRRHTAVAGASLGGKLTLALAREHHEQFALCGAISPSLWWARGQLLKELAGGRRWMRRMRFWVDMGTREGVAKGEIPPAILRTRKLIQQFDAAGLLPGLHYYYWEVAGGEHSEAHWAARFDKFLLYFFGRRRERHA